MSVGVAALPSWKLALIERKRRQDIDSHSFGGTQSNGSDVSDHIPPWKQEVLSRKQQKRLGRRFDGFGGEVRRSLTEVLVSPEDSRKPKRSVDHWGALLSPIRDSSYDCDLKPFGTRPLSVERENSHRDDPVEEERLPLVHENPILLFDLEKRQQSGCFVGVSAAQSPGESQKNSLLLKLSELKLSGQHRAEGDGGDPSASVEHDHDGNDGVFDEEEEVLYGKGFVSKLLQKFTYLSGRDDVMPSGSRATRVLSRGQSSEDFSKSSSFDVGIKPAKPWKKKASSLDDLLQDVHSSFVESASVANSSGDESVRWSSQAPDTGVCVEGGHVHSVKSIFESLAASPTSAKNFSLPFYQDHQSTEPSGKNDASNEEIENRIVLKNHDDDDDSQRLSGIKNSRSETSVKSDISPAVGVKPFIVAHPASVISCQDQPVDVVDAEMNIGDKITDVPAIDLGKTAQNLLYMNRVSDTKTSSNVHLNAVVRNSEVKNPEHKDITYPKDGNVQNVENRSHHMASIQQNQENEEQKMAPSNSVTKQGTGQSGRGIVKQSDVRSRPEGEQKKSASRPGLLLIRPASNLTSIKSEHLQMTKYNDITQGEFAPAKRPTQSLGSKNDGDDSDDGESDVNISKYLNVRYEFEGASVQCGRSLLAKTKQGIKLKINFDDAATSTYEYPSEQSLIDSMPPEPGDADYTHSE